MIPSVPKEAPFGEPVDLSVLGNGRKHGLAERLIIDVAQQESSSLLLRRAP